MQVDIALEPEFSASELAELGALAEHHGIRTLWVTNDPQARDLFMLHARVAEVTSRIRLGVMAVTPLEMHPLKMAAALQTLNELSDGRAAIVVGGGGAILAHTKLDLSRRVLAVRECIAILKNSGAGPAQNFAGELYPVWRYRNAWALESQPTVLAGANVDQMLRMSARNADGIHMSDMPLGLASEAMQKVRGALESHQRTADGFEFNNFWAFHVKEDRAEAELEARSRLVLRGLLKPRYIEPFLTEAEVKIVADNMPSFYKPFHNREDFCKHGGTIENVAEDTVATLVRKLTLTSSAAELDDNLGILHDFAAAGLTHITLGLHDNPADMIKLIGERVIPALKNS
jgi:alkanesulfonate monooxygenase SsuD/methylene tetrahydromethanopterin reductase-like flavin-dependent oxidoreductase (luciferase family)